MNSWRSTGQHKISGFGLWISSTPQNQRKKVFFPGSDAEKLRISGFRPPTV